MRREFPASPPGLRRGDIEKKCHQGLSPRDSTYSLSRIPAFGSARSKPHML